MFSYLPLWLTGWKENVSKNTQKMLPFFGAPRKVIEPPWLSLAGVKHRCSTTVVRVLGGESMNHTMGGVKALVDHW